MKDDFPYAARWDSVGLDCAFCAHFRGPHTWPDRGRESFCTRHQVSLSVELGENGYKSGEWFCRDFSDTGRANRRALAHLRQVRGLLDPGILYGFYGSDGRLKERLLRSLGSDDEGESGKEG